MSLEYDNYNESYVTVAERLKEFVEKWMPQGYFMKTIPSHFSIETAGGVVRGVVFEAQVFKRDSDGAEHFVCNGFAEERDDASEFNKWNYFETAETSARGRALGALGIGLNGSIATKDEISHREKIVAAAKAKKPSKMRIKEEDTEDTLRRLKLQYVVDSGSFIVDAESVGKKTADVLKRKGFVCQDGKWIKEE